MSTAHWSDTDEIVSPCVSICRMDARLGAPVERAAGGLCVGCLRSIDEIVAWGKADDDQKRAILARVADRRHASRKGQP